MGFFDRYLMRASGERQHQMIGPAERATAAALDVLRRRNMLPPGDEAPVLAAELFGDIERAIGRVLPPGTLAPPASPTATVSTRAAPGTALLFGILIGAALGIAMLLLRAA